MTGRECPGCGHKPIAGHRAYCAPCGRRLPAHLADAVAVADKALRVAVADAVAWLKTHPRVTTRELDVIELVSHGLPNAEIAARLHVTEDTVKSTLAAVGRRWGCHGRGSRAHVVATAFRLGYLRTERTETAV